MTDDLPTGPDGVRIEAGLARTRALIASGDMRQARELSDAMLARDASHPGVLIQRSRLESTQDNYRSAREYALAAFRAGVRNKRQCVHLLRRLRTFHLDAELAEFVTRIPPPLMHDPDVAQLVAISLQVLGNPEAALEYLRAAIERSPGSALLLTDAATALISLGRFGEAKDRLLAALRQRPDHAPAWWHLCRLPGRGSEGDHIARLRLAVDRAADPGDRSLLLFALHRELDASGDHPRAANALDLACRSMRGVVKYSPEEDQRLFAALKAMPTGTPRSPIEMPFIPVFIVGMHRSGTTLLEQLLSGHPDICAGGELYDFTSQLRFAADHHCPTEVDLQIVHASERFEDASIGRAYLGAVDWRRSGQRFVTDKLPSNFLNIGFILRALPEAKILHMSRDPVETCFSNLREPFSATTCRYSYDQAELAEYYRLYFDLMQHWRKVYPGRIHDVTYAALAANPAAELKRVATYLGTDFDPGMLEDPGPSRSVNTASAVQVRQKPELRLKAKWLPYREYLTPLVWRLSEIGQRY
jgi:tetratricopeptide (TPR) repeat protein